MKNTTKKGTANRILDSLNKYSNHQITSIKQFDDYIRLEISYYSEKFNTITNTVVDIYCDNYSIEDRKEK